MSRALGGDQGAWHRVLAALLLLQLIMGLYGIAQPIAWGHEGYHVAEHGLSARNLVRHEQWIPSHHHGPGPLDTAQSTYHHPIMLHPYIAAATSLLGEQPWVSRGVQLLFSLLALLGLWTLTRQVRCVATAAFACAAFVITPLNIAFSHLPDHQLIALAYMLWSFVGLVRWLRTSGYRWLALWLGMSLMVGLTDWPWFPVAFVLAVGLGWRVWRGGAPDWHPSMTPARVLWALAAFCVVVLLPFSVHFALAYQSPRWADLLLAYHERGGGSPIGHFFSNTMWRLYALHTPPLVVVTCLWLWRTLRRRQADMGSLLIVSVFVGQTIWLSAMKIEFLIHEYRSYWYVVPAAFAAGDVGMTWIRSLRAPGRHPRLRRNGVAIVLVLVLGWSVMHVPHNLVTSRRMGGSISHQSYEPRHELMAAARLVREMSASDRDLVLIGGALEPRKEVFYLLDRRTETIWSPKAIEAALASGHSVVVIEGVKWLRETPAYRDIFYRARTLQLGSIAILDLRSDASPAVDAVTLVLGEDYGPLGRWVNAPMTGPIELRLGPKRSAMWLARQLDAPDSLVDSARRSGDVLDSLPLTFRAKTSRAEPRPAAPTR